MSAEAIATIERLLAEAEQLPDPSARALARSLAAALVDLVGAGLSRVIELGGPELLRKLADDELVGNLLVLAGTHPDSPTVRARRALEAATAELHTCGVTLVSVEDGPRVVLAAERGTPIDDARVHAMVDAIVLSRAPDAEPVQLEITGRALDARGFVPIERLRVIG